MTRRKLIGPNPYTREQLTALPTLAKIADRLSFEHSILNHLKINTDNKRVWLSESGMVTEEINVPRIGWHITQRYHLKDLDALIARTQLVQQALIDMNESKETKAYKRSRAGSSCPCSLCNSLVSSEKLFLVCAPCLAAVRVLNPKAHKSKDS